MPPTKIVAGERIEYIFGDRTAQIELVPGTDGLLVLVTFDGESFGSSCTGSSKFLPNASASACLPRGAAGDRPGAASPGMAM